MQQSMTLLPSLSAIAMMGVDGSMNWKKKLSFMHTQDLNKQISTPTIIPPVACNYTRSAYWFQYIPSIFFQNLFLYYSIFFIQTSHKLR